MASMVRRASHGLKADSDEDLAPPPLPPKQSLWSQLPGAGGAAGYERLPLGGQDEASEGMRRKSYAELSVVGSGSPMLGGPATRRKPYRSRKVTKSTVYFWVLGALLAGGLLFGLVKVANSTRTPSYHCPDPRLPRPSSLPSKHFSSPISLPASHLPEASSAFSLSLSYSTTTCNSFNLLISRTSGASLSRCRQMEQSINPADDDPVLEKWVREKLGPDSFAVQIEGAERLMMDVPSEYLGDCRYLYRFRLNNAGRVWMNVSLVYEDYQAFHELDAPEGSRPKPHIQLVPLVPAPVELDLCSLHCPSHVPTRLGPPSLIPPSVRADPAHSPLAFIRALTGSTSSSAATDLDPRLSDLPSCHSIPRTELDGAYVPSSPIDLIHPPYPVPLDLRSTRPTAGLYTYVPSQCSYRHAGLRFRDHTSCLTAPHNAFFLGDSHARGVFDIVKHRLEGNDSVAEASPKALNKNAYVGNLYMEFMWDPYLTAGLDCDFIRKYDSITISSGTHQLSWNCPRASALLAQLTKVLATWPSLLRQCHARPSSSSTPRAQKNPKLVFLLIPPFHPQLHNHDCRTGPRIGYINENLRESAEENGWEVVDVERYVKPVAVDQLVGDGVHYLRLDAAEPVADDFIDLLDICDQE
ncbi:hypothetical protein JCM11251_001917 [Rhodosporidiobolus azoricus]